VLTTLKGQRLTVLFTITFPRPSTSFDSEAHGGRLWATPNAKHGATFHFTVPALA